MRASIRFGMSALALLALFSLAAPSALDAQEPEDFCSQLLDPLNRQITENWDDLGALAEILDSWSAGIQAGFTYYDPGQLEEMSAERVAELKDGLVLLRDCLPRIAMTFDRLKKRIEELQNAPSVVGTEDRLRQRRIRQFREMEQLHAEVAAALDAILG